MRTITPEYIEECKRLNPAYARFLNTPRPDHTELHRQSMIFREWIKKEHEKDRQRIREALKEDR